MLRDEWIGRSVVLKGSRVQGKIVDETMHTFKLELVSGKRITIMKQAHTFVVGKVEVEGRLLVARPHDRLKRRKNG